MDSYDLGRLTDFDFEVVCRDLFSNILEEDLELFSAGRDEGVDLRYLSPKSEQHVIIQCKHWIRSNRATLIRHMENVELPKIRHLSPNRYILACTVEITKEAKDKLFDILSPYVLSPGDIYGIYDIVALLKEYPDVVRRHLRLWLSSTTVLQSILNKGTLLRSSFLRDDLDQSLMTYAPNDSYGRAARILEETRVCVIAGIPGIGKTTLAQVLAASYVEKGYELIEISEDAEEISKTWDDSTPQFFYYDDFLGQTTLGDKLRKNEDSRLIALIRKISRSANKCLVLTTREYILAQAKQQYARLSSPSFDISTCVLDLADYTRAIRAEILYNHIYYSSIPRDVKAQFGDREIYEQIIDHAHFNPRLIAQSLELPTTSAARSSNVVQTVIANLANPRNLWEHIVNHELDEADIQLLHVLLTFPPRVPLDALEEAWSGYRRHLGEPDSTRVFLKSVDTLENTMLRTERGYKNKIHVSFHNPSVQDFLQEHLPGQRGVTRRLIDSMRYFEQMAHLWTVASGDPRRGRLPRPNSDELMSEITRVPELVEDFILRNLNGPAVDSDEEPDWVLRRATSLKVADKLGLESVINTVFQDLKGNWTEEVFDGDDLVSLVNAAAAIDSDVARANRGAIIQAAIDWITADTSDWSNLRAAEQYLHDLGDLVPEWKISSIQDDIMERAEHALESWTENDKSLLRWSELDDVLDFADQHQAPELLFPGYSAARESLIRHRGMLQSANQTNNQGIIDLRAEESARVHDIMHLLQED